MLRCVACNLPAQKGKPLHVCVSCNADIHLRCGKSTGKSSGPAEKKKTVTCQRCFFNKSKRGSKTPSPTSPPSDRQLSTSPPELGGPTLTTNRASGTHSQLLTSLAERGATSSATEAGAGHFHFSTPAARRSMENRLGSKVFNSDSLSESSSYTRLYNSTIDMESVRTLEQQLSGVLNRLSLVIKELISLQGLKGIVAKLRTRLKTCEDSHRDKNNELEELKKIVQQVQSENQILSDKISILPKDCRCCDKCRFSVTDNNVVNNDYNNDHSNNNDNNNINNICKSNFSIEKCSNNVNTISNINKNICDNNNNDICKNSSDNSISNTWVKIVRKNKKQRNPGTPTDGVALGGQPNYSSTHVTCPQLTLS